jgi:hypothetical protein
MEVTNRRGFLRMIGCAAVVSVVASTGVTFLPTETEAAPVPADKNLPKALEEIPVEKAQYRYYGRPYYRGVRRRYYRRRRRYYRRGIRFYRRRYRRARRYYRRTYWW